MRRTFRQLIGFSLVSSLVTIIQLVLVNVLLIAMRSWRAPLPSFLAVIFNENTVGAGNDNWGYVLPFFLSNAIANIFGWFQNGRTTFHSRGKASSFLIYFIVVSCLILFSTWLQGTLVNRMNLSFPGSLKKFAPTIAAMIAGMIQFAVLFPLEKYVLLKEDK